MPDDRPRAPDLLRDYLADRDIPCESCGYNLRAAQGVQCPECGTVIPRPPADFIARRRADPASLRLACKECGHVVTGVDAPRCPECGSTSLKQFTGDTPPRRRRRRRLPSVTILLVTAVGLLVAMTCIAEGLSLAVAGRGTGRRNPWLGAALALIPVAVGVAWMWWRPSLIRLEPGERNTLATIGAIVGVIAIILALRAL